MLLKLYFWIITIISVFSILLMYILPTMTPRLALIDWIGLVLSIPSLIGLYVYAYRKKVLTTNIWKFIFWLTISIDAVSFIYYSLPSHKSFPLFIQPNIGYSRVETLISMIFELPILYALYQLAFNSNWHAKTNGSKFQLDGINSIKTAWWKISSVLIVLINLFNLFALGYNKESLGLLSSDGGIAFGLIRLLELLIGVLLWFRLNLALYILLVFYIFRTAIQLVAGFYGEFFISVIILVSLFVLTVKSQFKFSRKTLNE